MCLGVREILHFSFKYRDTSFLRMRVMVALIIITPPIQMVSWHKMMEIAEIIKYKNEYQIIDFSGAGLPCVEIRGESFCYEDLYELIGQHGFMATFNIKAGTPTHSEFGKSVTGTILYAPNEAKESTNDGRLKIRSVARNLKSETIEELKYGGLDITAIESVSFLPLKRERDFHETGEKKVPNIINIELGADELERIDVNKLQQSLLVRKNKDGVRLADFEKEDLVGITLALNNGHIDSRILKHLGFNKETMMANINVWNSYYNAKARLNTLSDSEAQKHEEIKDIIRIERMIKLLQEIEKSGAKGEELTTSRDTLKEIIDAVLAFRPHVLLHGKMQVYWDVNSYIHIAMRHFQKYQLGSFKGKTSFSYKVEELETLIEQVLRVVKDEYKSHISKKPESDFTRKGKMAVEFNGDHYTVQITPEGRLVRFHAW